MLLGFYLSLLLLQAFLCWCIDALTVVRVGGDHVFSPRFPKSCPLFFAVSFPAPLNFFSRVRNTALGTLGNSTPRNTTIVLPCRRRVLGADDRHQHAAALGAGGRGDPGQPGHLHANRQGLAVRVHRFDGHLGERLPQGGVAGTHGRDHVDTTDTTRHLLA